MRLKEMRKSNGMTQERLAVLLGIPTKTYQNYEREVREPDSDILCKLADIYDCSVDELLGRDYQNTDDVSALIELFNQLDLRGQAKLIEIADDMVKSGKYTKSEMQDNQISELEEIA